MAKSFNVGRGAVRRRVTALFVAVTGRRVWGADPTQRRKWGLDLGFLRRPMEGEEKRRAEKRKGKKRGGERRDI